MFWATDTMRTLDRAKKDLKEADQLIADLNEVIKELTFDEYDRSASFDFTKINAVSIERIATDENGIYIRPVTVIGYILPNSSKIEEWFLYVTPENHEKLVKRFNEVKNIKD